LPSNFDWRILATDISTRALAKAEAGVFSDQRVESLSQSEQGLFFEKASKPNEWVVRPHIRERITFRRLNLLATPYPMRGPFDIVFCRNVMIYFDQIVRQKVVSAIEQLVRPGGYFLIGHAEALSGIHLGLHMLRPSVFFRPEAAP